MTDITISSNIDEVREQVRDLSVKINRAITRNALRSAATVIKAAARDNLRAQGSGQLAKDLTTSSRVSHTEGQARIGARNQSIERANQENQRW